MQSDLHCTLFFFICLSQIARLSVIDTRVPVLKPMPVILIEVKGKFFAGQTDRNMSVVMKYLSRIVIICVQKSLTRQRG